MIPDSLSIASFALGIFGLLVGYLQHRARAKTEDALRTQLSLLVNRIRIMVSYRKDLEAILTDVQNPSIHSWVWQKYQGLSDLYVSVVAYYLAAQKRFTYRDLERFVKAGAVQTRWEENVWRDLLALRRENKNRAVPSYHYTNENTDSHSFITPPIGKTC